MFALAAASCSDPNAPVEEQNPLLDASNPPHHVLGSGHVELAAGLREFTFHAIERPDGAQGSYKIVQRNQRALHREPTAFQR